jgi:hypothetical protein
MEADCNESQRLYPINQGDKMKELINQLDKAGMLEYGSVIDGDYLRSLAGIQYPQTATLAEFEALKLEELGIVDAIRVQLLRVGKYLKADRKDYRILTPSENASQVEAYMRAADQKLKRAITLNKNSPPVHAEKCNNMARAMVKQESIRRRLSSIAGTA